MVIVGPFQMKYSLLCSNLRHFWKLFANPEQRHTNKEDKNGSHKVFYHPLWSLPPPSLFALGLGLWEFSLAGLHVWGRLRNTSRSREGALSCSAKARQGCSQEQPISQHPGILALQTSTPKRFKGHPGSSRSWVVARRLYSWTEGLNMVIVNLCPFVGLIPDLFPAPPLLGLGMHQISWFQWVTL